MAIFDLFSKRNKKDPDVYQVSRLPDELRVQLVHLFQRELGEGFDHAPQGNVWASIAQIVAEEAAILSLPLSNNRYRLRCPEYADILEHILREKNIELVLDAVELTVGFYERQCNQHAWQENIAKASKLADQVNIRFREHGVGYEYQAGRFIRVDSQFVHAEIVLPALHLLTKHGFEGPNKEFLNAHQLYREGNYELSIVESCKAFESAMKAICSARNWPIDPKAAAAKLIAKLAENGLIAGWSEEQSNGLRIVLTGLPGLRNASAGHGAGPVPRDVSEADAAFALHSTAANIIYLVARMKTLT